MLVKDIMTKNPISIPLNYSVSKAYKLMLKEGFSQLPVVDKDNKLVGLITNNALEEVSSDTSLNDYERNYLLNQTKLQDIIQTGFFVIDENTIIENAALIIKENRISSICVINSNKNLCGIITKTDVFKALIDIMNIKSSGTRVYLKCDIGKNVYKELSDFFYDEEITIINFCTTQKDDHIEISIKLDKGDISSSLEKLKDLGYTCFAITTRI